MKKIVLSILVASAFTANSFAGSTAALAVSEVVTISAKELAHEIDVAEWSFKHSSMALTLDGAVVDKSIVLLSKAREELAAGNARTAHELTRRASRPLSEMDPAAVNGNHPGKVALHTRQVRETLLSIIDAAERIATEKSVPTDFVTRARNALHQSDTASAAGQHDQARALLLDAYSDVQLRVAQLRSGDYFYIETPKVSSASSWQDGLRRIDERRQITRYLILEAQSDGVDVGELQAGVRAAEAAVAEAAELAKAERWDRALQSLDVAYARYEESWRAVGIEW